MLQRAGWALPRLFLYIHIFFFQNKKSGSFYQTTPRRSTKNNTLYNHRRQKLKSSTVTLYGEANLCSIRKLKKFRIKKINLLRSHSRFYLLLAHFLLGLLFDSEHGSSTFLRNVGKLPLDCIVLYSRRWRSSKTH
jgi:hypothetical protein